MLDINLFRVEKGGSPDLIRESQRRRCAPVETVDEVIVLDKEWVKLRFEVDECNKEANTLQKEIAERKKTQQDAEGSIAQRQAVLDRKAAVEASMAAKEAQRNARLLTIGNLVHDSVPVSGTEDDNGLVRTWFPEGSAGAVRGEGLLAHNQVLSRLDGYDAERGSKVVGHRGYFLKNWGLRLNQAMINYGLDFLGRRDYTLLQTPFMMRREMMAKCAQLDDFDEQLYKVTGEAADEPLYLIATSEQPIACYHADEWFDEPARQLPARYAGYSTCFRKEAGSSGKDTWGLFRIHQFEKVEQFVLTEPEHSWAMFEEMIGHSEAFFQSLGIGYRVVAIVSGALNNAAAKKYDLEAWFPNYGQFKELVSCSNCTDYQSRRLEIRCGAKKMGDREKKYVHCLNSTLCATERALCCILETYQTPDGLRVPAALQPYLGGTDFIPYSKPAPAAKG